MTPLWEVLGALVPPQPRSPAAAAHLWRYAELREQVMEAGRLISAEEAERRVLILENPAAARAVLHHAIAVCRACSSSCRARWRRPTGTHQSALRLVLDGEGAYHRGGWRAHHHA